MTHNIISGWLDVGQGHQIYWEQRGVPDGVPVLVVHGGPGDGMYSHLWDYFDPGVYRVVMFDQRGTGKSIPLGAMHNNNTGYLVVDMALLLDHLMIDRAVIFGGSWGAALSLAFARTCPQRCLTLVVYGIFLGRDEDEEWFLYGAKKFFPDVWDEFSSFLPVDERDDLVGGYQKRVMDDDPAVHQPAVRAFLKYMYQLTYLQAAPANFDSVSERDVAAIRIFLYYSRAGYFLRDDPLLKNPQRFADVPGYIVQGRYDMDAPPEQAYALAKSWPKSRLVLVPAAGHGSTEPAIRKCLMQTMIEIAL